MLPSQACCTGKRLAAVFVVILTVCVCACDNASTPVGLPATGPEEWQWTSHLVYRTLTSFWASSDSVAFAVGVDGHIFHYDGAVWRPMTEADSATLYDVWGVGPRDVFAVGDAGTILHYDGADWSAMDSGTLGRLSAVWGRSPTDVYAVGDAILHYDGSSWSRIEYDTIHLRDVFGIDADDVFMVGAAWEGASDCPFPPCEGTQLGVVLRYVPSQAAFEELSSSHYGYSLWASSLTDIYMIGSSITGGPYSDPSSVMHYDGAGWNRVVDGAQYGGQFSKVWGTGPTDVYALAWDQVLHNNGSGWTTLASLPRVMLDGWTVGGTTYVVGRQGAISQSEGAGFVPVREPIAVPGIYSDACLDAADNLIAVGGMLVVTGNPENGWTSAQLRAAGVPNRRLHAAWASSDEVFAVGWAGLTFRRVGGAWTRMTQVTDQPLNSVWGTANDDVFAVGWYGSVVHYDGVRWSSMETPTEFWLNGVWGASSRNVFAVGQRGTILNFDGENWTVMASPTDELLNDVWGRGHDDVYAVGSNGTILHFDGETWTLAASNTSSDLSAVHGNTQYVYASGPEMVLLSSGGDWSPVLIPDGRLDGNGIAVFESGAYVVGRAILRHGPK